MTDLCGWTRNGWKYDCKNLKKCFNNLLLVNKEQLDLKIGN